MDVSYLGVYFSCWLYLFEQFYTLFQIFKKKLELKYNEVKFLEKSVLALLCCFHHNTAGGHSSNPLKKQYLTENINKGQNEGSLGLLLVRGKQTLYF